MADENSTTTVTEDGELAVKVVNVSGTLVSGPSIVDTTALVQTEAGIERAVKSFPLGGGGGGGYVLPTATDNRLGGIKVGENLSVEADGTLNAQAGSQYELPPATADTLGGIKVGQNLSVEADGTLNAQAGGSGADTSLSNITSAGKGVITSMAAPSNSYIALTPTNNGTYTAPADGWFVFYGITLSTNNDAYIYHAGNSENRMNSIRVFATTIYGNDKIIGVSYPAKSGEVVGLAFTNVKFTDVDYSNLGLRFFYLEGNKPEGN